MVIAACSPVSTGFKLSKISSIVCDQ